MFNDGHMHASNKFILLCRVFLFFTLLFTGFICYDAASSQVIESTQNAIFYLIAITGIIIGFIVYTTNRIIKIHRRHHNSRSKHRKLSDSSVDDVDSRELHSDGFEDADETKYKDFNHGKIKHHRVDEYIDNAIITIFGIALLHLFMICIMLRLYFALKKYEKIQKQLEMLRVRDSYS